MMSVRVRAELEVPRVTRYPPRVPKIRGSVRAWRGHPPYGRERVGRSRCAYFATFITAPGFNCRPGAVQ
jgi:hypothetical protein